MSQFATPDEALAALLAPLQPVGTESVAWQKAAGRVLAEAIMADRDSPPFNNSAMDGYAMRVADVLSQGMVVADDVQIGCQPPALPPGKALRIVTGAPVPDGADAVVRSEDVELNASTIVLRPGVELKPGQYIRRQGENVKRGEPVLESGRKLDAAAMSAAATFGAARLAVYRRVRVALLVTGNELRSPESLVGTWELRDANGPALWAMLSSVPWLELVGVRYAKDDPAAIAMALRQCLAECAAVLLTGGVSMGQHDHVPDVVAAEGATIVVRKLPIRPGHPLLGAISRDGQPILGLPGNPVSVMVTARRFAAAMLKRVAGVACPTAPVPMVALVNPDQTKSSPLWWFRPVRLVAPGQAELLQSKSSGDVVSAANSDGFVELPPNAQGAGPWPFWRWTLD